ncbi:MAG: hypothetical protein RR847_01900 [Bacilli bacterium]
MKILKQENWWIWLLLIIMTQGTSTLILGALLDVYDKNAWYAKWYYWLLGFACFIIPGIIMLYIFFIQILCLTAGRLNIPGKELYLTPYTFILCVIIPVIGWILLFVTILYLQIWTIVSLYRGYEIK